MTEQWHHLNISLIHIFAEYIKYWSSQNVRLITVCWKTVTQLLFLNSKIICTFLQQNLDQNKKKLLKAMVWSRYSIRCLGEASALSFRAVNHNWGSGYEQKRTLNHVKITDPKYSVRWVKNTQQIWKNLHW